MLFSKKNLFLTLSLLAISTLNAIDPTTITVSKVQTLPDPSTGPVLMGQPVTYTITVTNNSTDKSISCIEIQVSVTPCNCSSPFISADDNGFGLTFKPTIDGFKAVSKKHVELAPGATLTLIVVLRACLASACQGSTNNTITNFVSFRGKLGCDEIAGHASATTTIAPCVNEGGAGNNAMTETIDAQTVNPGVVFACIGGQFNLQAKVTNNCGDLKYQWYQANACVSEVALAVDCTPTSDTGIPGFWQPVGTNDPHFVGQYQPIHRARPVAHYHLRQYSLTSS